MTTSKKLSMLISVLQIVWRIEFQTIGPPQKSWLAVSAESVE